MENMYLPTLCEQWWKILYAILIGDGERERDKRMWGYDVKYIPI